MNIADYFKAAGPWLLAWAIAFIFIPIDFMAAIVYNWLAGWEIGNLLGALILLPIVTGSLICLFRIKRHLKKVRTIAFIHLLAGMLIVWAFLPVISNLVSICASLMDLHDASLFIFKCRYLSLAIVPGVAWLITSICFYFGRTNRSLTRKVIAVK